MTILDTHAQVGCQFLSLHEWSRVNADKAEAMGGIEFFKAYAPHIIAIAKANGRSFARPKAKKG